MFGFLKKSKKRYRVGLVLSGGGLRGIGHLGAIKALHEYGYQPDVISGCSAGAIIGALYAGGYSPDEILKIALESDLFPKTSLRFRLSGFMDNSFLIRLFQKHLSKNHFEKLDIPLYVAVTDFRKGEIAYLHAGDLDEAILASSSIPFLFSPVKTNDTLYYDGGILNNLPVEPIRDQCDFLIGVHVNSLEKSVEAHSSTVKTMDRIIHLAINQSVYRNAEKCNLFLDPPDMGRFSMFDKKDIQPIYDHAYAYTVDKLSAMR